MLRTAGRLGIVALAGLCSSVSAQTQLPRQAAAPTPQGDTLRTYCVTCHNQRLKTAGLSLDTLDIEDVGPSAAVWEKVIAKLRTGAMPPVGRPRPDEERTAGLVAFLEDSIDRAAAAAPNPGRPAVHRLNRAEYTNAIRDLLAVDVDGQALLPADDSGYGFDNIGDVALPPPRRIRDGRRFDNIGDVCRSPRHCSSAIFRRRRRSVALQLASWCRRSS